MEKAKSADELLFEIIAGTLSPVNIVKHAEAVEKLKDAKVEIMRWNYSRDDASIEDFKKLKKQFVDAATEYAETFSDVMLDIETNAR